VLRKKFKM